MAQAVAEVFGQRHIAGRRQPLQPVGQHEQQQRRGDEFRQRDAEIGDEADAEVGGLPRRSAATMPSGTASDQHQHDREQPPAAASGRAPSSIAGADRLAGAHRGAEIAAAATPAEPVPDIAARPGSFEPELARARAASASGVAFSPSSDDGRVGRQELGDAEDQQRDTTSSV